MLRLLRFSTTSPPHHVERGLEVMVMYQYISIPIFHSIIRTISSEVLRCASLFFLSCLSWALDRPSSATDMRSRRMPEISSRSSEFDASSRQETRDKRQESKEGAAEAARRDAARRDATRRARAHTRTPGSARRRDEVG